MTQKYQINELGTEATYIELRIFTYIECEEKINIITKILNFFNNHDFVTNLTMLYHVNMRAENMVEKQNCASLTLDMRDEKFRFKYWDGSKTYWAYHIKDLFDILLEGRNKHSELVEKYKKLTIYIFEFKEQYKDAINRLTYKYYPSDDVDILYEIQFDTDMKEQQAKTDMILKELYEKISKYISDDMKIDIDYTFKTKCIPCQKAKERRESAKND